MGVGPPAQWADRPGGNPEPTTFTIADFNNGAMSNNLQAEMGTWEMDPDDEFQSIEASLDRNIRWAGAATR